MLGWFYKIQKSHCISSVLKPIFIQTHWRGCKLGTEHRPLFIVKYDEINYARINEVLIVGAGVLGLGDLLMVEKEGLGGYKSVYE